MSKANRPKMTRDIVPEGFTLSLALVDALPVLFFGGSMLLLGSRFSGPLFLLGALLCLIGGACKVLWKLIVVLKRKNIWPLFLQMRILMPIGMALMLLSLLVYRRELSFPAILAALTAFPACVCFLLGLLGMILMMVFAARLDSSDAKANWIEQLTNGAAQAMFFLGIWLSL